MVATRRSNRSISDEDWSGSFSSSGTSSGCRANATNTSSTTRYSGFSFIISISESFRRYDSSTGTRHENCRSSNVPPGSTCPMSPPPGSEKKVTKPCEGRLRIRC